MVTAFIRTIILYLVLIIGLRLTGKRQIGELEPIELVLTLLLSDLASVPMQDFGIPLLNGLVPILTLLSLSTLFSYFSLRSVRFRSLVCGEPAIIIRDGKLLQNVMRHNRLTLDELLEELRGQGVCDIDDVKYAILETSGQISFLPKSQNRPATPEDLALPTEPCGLWIDLVMDGKLLDNGLKKTGRDRQWLNTQLHRQAIGQLSEVFYAACDQNGNFIACRGK